MNKSVAAALREALLLSEAALESTADGILVVDEKGTIRSFNRRFVQMWRLPKRVVSSRSDNAALSFVLSQLKEPEQFLRRVRELYATPGVESFDSIEFKDGRLIERYSRPQRIESKYVGRVWSFRDVTLRRELERKLSETSGREQARFGRELHDSIGQTLTAIMLLTKSAAKAQPKKGAAAKRMREIVGLCQTAIGQVRNLARGLLPPDLQAGDFATSLHALAEGARGLFATPCFVTIRGDASLSDKAAAVELYRIAQEAVYNAAKHARSKSGIRISFDGGPQRLKLKISDSGIGLPARTSDRAGAGLGLAIMHHRAQLLRGTLITRRGPKGGTVVVLDCPRPLAGPK